MLSESDLSRPYGYVPTLSATIIFVVLFSVSCAAIALHLGQSIYYRIWWLLPTAVFSGLIEIMGWAGRVWSSVNASNLGPYEMQMTLTIIGPTPLLAASFVILDKLIHIIGMQYSRLDPKWSVSVFVFCFELPQVGLTSEQDIVSLVIQAVGGGTAAVAVSKYNSPEKGGNIMLGGIVFQMFSMALFVVCGAEFLWRYFKDRPVRSLAQNSLMPDDTTAIAEPRTLTPKIKTMLGSVVFSTLCLFIRSIYRTIELSNGFAGRIIHTQLYFNILDGMMIVLAMYTLNIFHPGILLADKPAEVEKECVSGIEKV
ncbi:RTA1 like protein [Fistulina hepatica ATCC 64428]|uniref:RTA1 like protein n=1 Tax=Fistulina hepatica ATCC 64428 TaxID=1128425 RepID=A0A0D7A6X8_9AGAR|nr:RTA1 like protein [Fistulina hepatica ATCC 64428]